MAFIGHLIALAAASPWALALVALVLVIDGFFPFLPGETLVVAAAAAGANPWLLLAVSVAAALAGDLLAFHIGRRLGVDRWISAKRPRLSKAFLTARRRLATDPASILITAKFMPFVRVAVSMTAGASGMSRRRYVPLALASVGLYTGFHVALGALVGTAAGSVLGNPLIALLVSVAVGFAVGAVIDLVRKRFRTMVPAKRLSPSSS